MKRRDEELTAAMYEAGVFEDKKKRSYVATWLHPGTAHRCIYLFGIDKTRLRQETIQRANGFCEGCDVKHWVGEEGEDDHIQGGLGRQRCDCSENHQLVCQEFHRRKHVAVRWTRREREAVT